MNAWIIFGKQAHTVQRCTVLCIWFGKGHEGGSGSRQVVVIEWRAGGMAGGLYQLWIMHAPSALPLLPFMPFPNKVLPTHCPEDREGFRSCRGFKE
jgi:hypothetical protein